MPPDIKAHGDRSDHAAMELQTAAKMRWRLHLDFLPVQGLAGDQPYLEGDLCQSRNAFDRTEQGHERRQVIGAHVKKRSSAGLVIKLGIRMPAFMAVAEHV